MNLTKLIIAAVIGIALTTPVVAQQYSRLTKHPPVAIGAQVNVTVVNDTANGNVCYVAYNTHYPSSNGTQPSISCIKMR